MSANYIFNSNSSTEILSKSLETLLPGAEVSCVQKNDKFKSHVNGLVDDGFFIGNFITENINNLVSRDFNSCLISLPRKGRFSIDISNKKDIIIPNKKGLLVFPSDKIKYHTPTECTDGYDIYIQMDSVNLVLNNKFEIPFVKPDYSLLDIDNNQTKSLYQFVESTLYALNSFPDISHTQLYKRNIKDITTLMVADIIAKELKAKPITENYPENYLVSNAESIINSECENIFTIQEIADKLFTSTRSVQIAFKKHRNYTPIQFLRSMKLHKAHKNILLNNSMNCTVKEIAYGVGLFNLNRFGKYYAEIFGELPSETIKKSQK